MHSDFENKMDANEYELPDNLMDICRGLIVASPKKEFLEYCKF